jgi:predicted AAA+ superfamily ATPase
VVEEKISLSERFGLWVSFYPFSQDEYLRVVAQWLSALGMDGQIEAARPEALVWALERGSRSGRVAHQFARDWAGRAQRAVEGRQRIADVDGLAKKPKPIEGLGWGRGEVL